MNNNEEITRIDVIEAYEKVNKLSYPKTKKYPDFYIFDENQSVKWNREEVKKQNELVNKQRDEYSKKRKEIYDKAHKIAIKYLNNYYCFHNFNEKQLKKIWAYAEEECHSYGITEVLSKAEDILDLIDDIIGLVE